jgi:hypothetical protein
MADPVSASFGGGGGSLISPTFTLSLGHPVLSAGVAVGRFGEGGNPALACATSGGRVLVHTGGSGGGLGGLGGAVAGGVRVLSVNKGVTALGCARLPVPTLATGGGGAGAAGAGGAGPGAGAGAGAGSDSSSSPYSERDVLVIGTGSTLQVYDVEANADVFFRDVPEAVSAVATGPWPLPASVGRETAAIAALSTTSYPGSGPFVFAGGNCTLAAFEAGGREGAWGVTGDVVTALAFADVDGACGDEGRGHLLCVCGRPLIPSPHSPPPPSRRRRPARAFGRHGRCGHPLSQGR